MNIFTLSANTNIDYIGCAAPVINAVSVLKRDIEKCFTASDVPANKIVLTEAEGIEAETFVLDVTDERMTINAGDDLGFVYGLLYISSEFLDIKPFWFWLDQRIERRMSVTVGIGSYLPKKPTVKYRGWFINDEVLIMKWAVNGDKAEPWRMAFEALLRCGGNTVIPGTDKDSKLYRSLASDMGLWITHHHAEPMGAEMFVRAYPGEPANYAETPEKFHKLWEEAVEEQKDMKVIWTLGFRGQGDCPFWSSDRSGKFDTDAKRGALISDVIELQRQMVLEKVENPVFCTNLYGEIMELYEAGHIRFADDIIKIGADNGFGKMVTRRRESHTVRISSLPKKPEKHGGIYYHVSFYDLQAANHITMLPNTVDFVNRELDSVAEMNAKDFWIINCSNIRPHAYYLDAVRKKWYGETISDKSHSAEFAADYYDGSLGAAECLRDYAKSQLAYGSEEDEHAGEQFYNENVRIFAQHALTQKPSFTGIGWFTDAKTLPEQIEVYSAKVAQGLASLEAYYKKCMEVSGSLDGETGRLFDSTILLQAKIQYFCAKGAVMFGEAYKLYAAKDWLNAFMALGDCASVYEFVNDEMRNSEYDVWKGFYFNECFADVKHTAYMLWKLMGMAREYGDNARHDKWYRLACYAPEDRGVLTLLVTDNHMEDRALYEAFKKQGV